MKIYVGVDTEPTTRKPDREKGGGYLYGKIRARAAAQWQETEITQFAELAGNQGHAFMSGHLEGGFTSDCCNEQQVFALDFDGGITVEDVKKRCETLSLPITMIYYTLSYIEGTEERFRMILVTQLPIRDHFVIKAVMCMLLWIFPEADRACKDLARIFLGGKKLVCFDETARVTMMYIVSAFRKALDKDGHYGRNAESFCRETGVLLWAGMPLIGYQCELDGLFGEKRDVNLNNYIYKVCDQKSPIFLIRDSPALKLHHNDTCQNSQAKSGRRLNLDNVKDKCRLLKDFYDGVALSHQEKFCIARSLLYIKGGKNRFLDTIREHYGERKYQKWYYDIKYMKRFGYLPSRCIDFCPYHDVCQEKTIIEALSDDHRINMLSRPEFVSLEEAQEQLFSNILSAVESKQDGLHLIRGQTGLGKTELYIRLALEQPHLGMVIAVPTNRLKQEIHERLREKGIPESDMFITPSIRNNCFIPGEEQDLIMEKHDHGIHNVTKQLIQDLLGRVSSESIAQREELRRIVIGAAGIQTQRIVITTHAYLVYLSAAVLKDRVVIIDEDILQQFINKTYQVDSDTLKILAESGIHGYEEISREMLTVSEGEYCSLEAIRKVPMTDKELEHMLELGCTGNFNDLYQARTYVCHKFPDGDKEIYQYFCPSYLKCRKAIILSATLNEFIYRRYFRNRDIITYPEKTAAYRGKVEQYSYYSLGRRDLGEKMKAFAFAGAFFSGDKPGLITFKKYADNIEVKKDFVSTGLHFGNTMGIDKFAGRNIAVVGTPFNHPDGDKLIGAFLGASVNTRVDRTPARRRVEYGNNSFVIPTYKDPILREVQLYRIQTDLEQSVGRARLLRNEATVLVLSSFPVAQARIHTDRYLEGLV